MVSRACGARAWAMAAARSPRPCGPRRRRHAGLPAFQFGHPLSFELANRIKALTPAGLDYVFFTGSGSESADTSLKMARAYWRAKGQGTKTRLIGREKGYHGVNRRHLGGWHRRQPQDVWPGRGGPTTCPTPSPRRLFHKGMPPTGGRLDRLLDVIACTTSSNIAAVIVEPFSARRAW